MGWTAEWELITSDRAPVHLNTHFELLPDKTARFVEKCTYKESEKEVGDKAVTEENMQTGNIYYTRYKKVTGIDSPVFCFDYPDGWSVSMEEINATEMISFNYPTPYVFYADAPDGQFADQEEKDVIEILQSFREVD